jgi:trigger factor
VYKDIDQSKNFITLNISLDKIAPTKASIKISFEKSDYQSTLDQKLREYGKKVQLKGFRPGKVPAGLVKKMYGKSILAEEVNRLLSSSLMNYIKEQELSIVGDPVPVSDQESAIDWDNPNVLDFSFEVGLASDFEVKPEDLTLTQYKITYTDEYFQKIVDNYLKSYGTDESPETIQSDEDKVTASIQPVGYVSPEKSEDEEIEFDEEGNEKTTVNSFPTELMFTLKDVKEDALEKVKALEKDKMTVLPIDELFSTELSELIALFEKDKLEIIQGDFEITVMDIRHRKFAEMNDEFFAKVFPDKPEGQTEETFQEHVRKQIEDYHTQESERKALMDVQKTARTDISIELPDEFLKDWLVQINEGKFSREQIEEEYDDFANSLRWDLITSKIARQEEEALKDGDNDVVTPWISYQEVKEAAYGAVLGQFGMPMNAISQEMRPQFEQIVNNYLTQENGKNYQQLYNQVSSEKVAKLFMEKASIVEQEIDIEDFYKTAQS